MGIFSRKKKEVPSMEEQQAQALARSRDLQKRLQMDNEEDIAGEVKADIFRIAGISFNQAKASDIGVIEGFATPYAHTKDKNAIAVIALDKALKQRLLGYIAKEDQKRFNDLTAGEGAAFVGYIKGFLDDSGRKALCGEIKVFVGEGQALTEALANSYCFLTGLFAGYYKESWLQDEGLTIDNLLSRTNW